jgi:hypothetical protein
LNARTLFEPITQVNEHGEILPRRVGISIVLGIVHLILLLTSAASLIFLKTTETELYLTILLLLPQVGILIAIVALEFIITGGDIEQRDNGVEVLLGSRTWKPSSDALPVSLNQLRDNATPLSNRTKRMGLTIDAISRDELRRAYSIVKAEADSANVSVIVFAANEFHRINCTDPNNINAVQGESLAKTVVGS